MFRSRRAWLLFPLLVLTLFFAVWGWRNWHLSMDIEEVWLALPAYYKSPMSRAANKLNASSGDPPLPFADNETTVLMVDIWGGQEPLSPTLLARLQKLCPKAHLLTAVKPDPRFHTRVYLGQTQLVNRFQAQCRVGYIRRKRRSQPKDGVFAQETFMLRRSPFLFQDPGWHVVGMGNLEVRPFILDNPKLP